MKILHVFGRMTRGGAEMRTLDLMRHIDPKDFRFHFYALSGLSGELDDDVRSLGGDVFLGKLGPGFPWKFRQFLRSREYQVVHSHVHLFSGYILRLAAKEGVPRRIAHFRNMDDGKPLTLARQIRNRVMKGWIDKHATDIVAVCEGAMKSAWGEQWQTDPRCRVIYNGIDVSRFDESAQTVGVRRELGFADDCNLFVHVGRMVRQKNHERVMAIFSEIAARQPNVGLVLVGRGGNDVEKKVREKVAKLKLEEKVAFVGEREDVPRLLKSADLMLFPSLWEGLPGAVLESCAAGTPVLASDLQGIREIEQQMPSLVKVMSLDDDNVEWALSAIKLCKQKAGPLYIAGNLSDFKKGIFNIDRCVDDFCRLWTGPAENIQRRGNSL